jgi:hypothetical protein
MSGAPVVDFYRIHPKTMLVKGWWTVQILDDTIR